MTSVRTALGMMQPLRAERTDSGGPGHSVEQPNAGRQLTVRRLLEGDPPPPPTLHVERFSLAGEVGLFGGGGDSGKSTTLFHLSVCTVLGRPVFGSLPVKQSGSVILLVPEDGEAVARHHVDALVAGMNLSAAELATLTRDLHIVGDDRPFNLLYDTPALARLISDIRPSLLVGDPIGSLIGDADENDQKVAESVYANLRRHIARPFGTTCVLAGHLRKPSREAGGAAADVHDLKGSVGWSNHARFVWTVSKPKGGNVITFRLVKSNRLPTGIEHQVTLAIDANPENAAHWLTCTLTDANIGASSQSLAAGVGRAINENERKALHAIDDRLEPGSRFSNSRWQEESGIASKDTFRSVKDRLLNAGLATAEPTGRMNPNGKSPVYQYGITDRGRAALNTGWVHERAVRGEGVSEGCARCEEGVSHASYPLQGKGVTGTSASELPHPSPDLAELCQSLNGSAEVLGSLKGGSAAARNSGENSGEKSGHKSAGKSATIGETIGEATEFLKPLKGKCGFCPRVLPQGMTVCPNGDHLSVDGGA